MRQNSQKEGIVKLVVKRLQSIPECRCQNFYSVTWRRDINILVSNPQRDFEKFIISFFFFWPEDILF